MNRMRTLMRSGNERRMVLNALLTCLASGKFTSKKGLRGRENLTTADEVATKTQMSTRVKKRMAALVMCLGDVHNLRFQC